MTKNIIHVFQIARDVAVEKIEKTCFSKHFHKSQIGRGGTFVFI